MTKGLSQPFTQKSCTHTINVRTLAEKEIHEKYELLHNAPQKPETVLFQVSTRMQQATNRKHVQSVEKSHVTFPGITLH